MSKTLVAFFSRAGENYFSGAMHYIKVGNTEIICHEIQKQIDVDTFKIEMKNPYSSVYMTCIDEAKRDLRNNARPEIENMPVDIDKYETIILAYPNYWGTCPMAIATFLETYDFTGKTILPLCTHEGSGMGSSESDIKKYAQGAIIKKGLAIVGGQVRHSQSAIKQWLKNNQML